METAVKRLYEGMFLVDSALAAQDWQKVNDEVQRILSRAEADVVSMKKWDDRRLCHEVQGVARGTYILVYFNCETDKIGGIERDVQLSELVLRTLILRTDRMGKDEMNKPTPLEAAEAESNAEAEPAKAVKADDLDDDAKVDDPNDDADADDTSDETKDVENETD